MSIYPAEFGIFKDLWTRNIENWKSNREPPILTPVHYSWWHAMLGDASTNPPWVAPAICHVWSAQIWRVSHSCCRRCCPRQHFVAPSAAALVAPPRARGSVFGSAPNPRWENADPRATTMIERIAWGHRGYRGNATNLFHSKHTPVMLPKSYWKGLSTQPIEFSIYSKILYWYCVECVKIFSGVNLNKKKRIVLI